MTVYYIGIVVITVIIMEFVAWLAHKYIMHGWGWGWHEDHHKPHFEKEGFFEKNDLFFLVFAIPSAASYMIGTLVESYTWLFFQRFSWFRQLDSPYSRAILRAHGAHHSKTGKEDGVSFGLLFVHPRYFRKASRLEK
ncbi:MAG: fatty acid hydroxylase [Saprospiraceae bacterium]|nr:fatty acid hydroxylase [Saprospiraceae bacterium]